MSCYTGPSVSCVVSHDLPSHDSYCSYMLHACKCDAFCRHAARTLLELFDHPPKMLGQIVQYYKHSSLQPLAQVSVPTLKTLSYECQYFVDYTVDLEMFGKRTIQITDTLKTDIFPSLFFFSSLFLASLLFNTCSNITLTS